MPPIPIEQKKVVSASHQLESLRVHYIPERAMVEAKQQLASSIYKGLLPHLNKSAFIDGPSRYTGSPKLEKAEQK